jgi:hypothetical protein
MNHETATAAGRRSALNAKSDDAAQVILEAVACAMIDNGASEDTALLYCTFFERGLAAAQNGPETAVYCRSGINVMLNRH